MDWVKNCEKRGVGEILLTSIDMEGTRKGFDFDLFASVSNSIKIPIIASGGFGKPSDITKLNRNLSDSGFRRPRHHYYTAHWLSQVPRFPFLNQIFNTFETRV